ncbi:BppU family phage baseplate upper protein [uncultured Trichococcus sp.]|uniref:BppU family phage baseplate upper protein n=1 Tax=uncultured Trichococcus sp. TaxID=189665 RepID=UPI002A187056|nr:hypothetical protein [uncultured Trichococcus sp.]
MADKLLKYDVAMKSTKTVWQMETPRCYTGDENTVTFDFNITDLEAADLVGVIPNVYLYMRDGSFFQNGPADGVEITGTIVNYTMKGNEGKHSGIARAQLVLVWDDEINPPEKLTSQLYDFEVVSGLENKVAVEVMIQDWTTLTREARTFIDTSSDEVDALKGELQTAINTANASLGEFDVALETGIVAANLATKLQDFETTNNSRLLSAEQQLAEKIGGTVKAELEDLSADVLGAIDGTGGPFDLLSIPQDRSVTPIKTDFLEEVNIGINHMQDKSILVSSYYDEAGSLLGSSLLFTISDYIPVEQNVRYSHNFYNARCYDANNNIISSVPNGTNTVIFTDGIVVKIRPNFRYTDTSVANSYFFKIGFQADNLLVKTENLDKDIQETLENSKTVIENVATIEDVRVNQFPTSKFMHISCDDFISPFQDITTNSATYTSLFDSPTFAFLKAQHKKYGMVFSGYCFYETTDKSFNLSQCTDKFADEFRENSSWLRFGFHSKNSDTNYATSLPALITTDFNLVTGQLLRITGSYKSIDRVLRLQNYAGNLESITAIKKLKGGIVGLLTAEDSRVNYYHNAEQTTRLLNYDRMYDSTNNLMFFSTDLRLDVVAGYDDLMSRQSDVNYTNQMNDILLLVHDPNINFAGFQTRIINCCNFAIENGYRFDFPMNVVMS